ncbi:Glycosyltransferase [Zea mays]|uniref:Glycosyltransferase n=1 Tax=Zea mays TaxID=4577 RepID=A0A1D6N4E7_MAIZE|nr:Glycosyltransferase [Zea mays]
MKTRSSARGEPRRLGNAALLALMLCSVVALSLIRGRFAPIGDAIKSEDDAAAAALSVSKAAVNVDTGDSADEAAAEAAAEEKEKEEVQPKPADSSGSGSGGSAAKPVCYETSRRSDTCEAAGDVRVVGSTQTVYVDSLDREWKTKPYCRKHDNFALAHVKEWSLKPLPSGAAPQCTVNSSATAFVLSTGGFTGNPFHDYTDVLIPAFITPHGRDD